MNNLLPFLGTYVVLTIWITGFVIAFRKHLTCMVGMMASMALGMTIGLGMGTLMAVWLSGQPFQATMASMLIGGLIGAVAGMPISLMAILDGLLSGIMGGMMGAMLTLMIPAPYIEPTVKIITVLCSGIIFLLFLMLQGEIKQEHLSQKPFLLSRPLSMFAVICFSFFMVHQTTIYNVNDSNNSHQHMTDTTQQIHTEDNPSKELLVKASDFSFSPSTIKLKAGEKIKITLENNGQVEHDFEVKDMKIHIHTGPGMSNSTITRFTESGSYTAICTLPGHKEAGMVLAINVY